VRSARDGSKALLIIYLYPLLTDYPGIPVSLKLGLQTKGLVRGTWIRPTGRGQPRRYLEEATDNGEQEALQELISCLAAAQRKGEHR
jgi:hypothetical protein